ncbi:MAG TPA: histidine kinase [Ferruginibacter sp.]|nr:histidine kinase [Ferruginibacter sp.]HRE63188.1 histidine kinase [Ferruginibacter sp.]
MKLQRLKYIDINSKVFISVAFVMTLLFNSINFPVQYYSDIPHFLAYSGIFILMHSINFKWSTAIMHLFINIFPKESDQYKRISIVLAIFLLILGLQLFGLFKMYGNVSWFNYVYSEKAFVWNFIVLSVLSIFRTFLLEGVNSYNEWKRNNTETEKLNVSYNQSRLNALKSQVNPHFLFNCLNTLSSLIQEDEEKAEMFLNEMSKVYRYMLRNDEETLVPLEVELGFIKSYHHLLKARYGDGLQLHIDIPDKELSMQIAPHSLQVIIENAFTQNIVSKALPLSIAVFIDPNGKLIVQNNVQPKTVTDAMDFEAGLDNLVKKYELLGAIINVDDSTNQGRVIKIPLFGKKEVMV